MDTRSTRASSRSAAPSTAAASKTTRTKTTATAPLQTPARKPFQNSNLDALSPTKKAALPAKPKAQPKPFSPVNFAITPDSEPITAYLRIRPNNTEYGDLAAIDTPYLERISEIAVRMTDPTTGTSSSNPHGRSSSITPSSATYNFSRVFEPDTNQSKFFETTTLPLIADVLNGRNALIFAYGVTNSGKTYTVHGGKKAGSAGILPRTLDVVFNSIIGLHSDDRFQPVRLHGIERVESSNSAAVAPIFDISSFATKEPALKQVIDDLQDLSLDTGIDHTVLKVDRNHEYSVWISYAEVYNEQVFDLLSAQDTSTGNSKTAPSIKRKALSVKSSPPSDGGGLGGRYVEGLRRFRVRDAGQAKALVRRGQLHRRAFGTLANSESSRSHGLVTITVVRGHRGARDDPESVQVSRLTLVDLAGSERNKNTNTTGDRLKEAGSINRSLLVLGQCMEVMRSNQRRLAQSLASPGRTDTQDVKRGLGVVPFRHSKVTEILMDFFDRDGRGRAVMIVNVNPFDTDFHENAHVMKFAALAREVHTAPGSTPLLRTPARAPATKANFHAPIKGSTLRQVTITAGGKGTGRRKSEAHLQILEEDEDETLDEDQNEDVDPLVNLLFDQIALLKTQLYESEMRAAEIETRIREQVVKEVTEQNRQRQRLYERHLFNDDAENAWKTDAKIDLLHKSGVFPQSPRKPTAKPTEIYDASEVSIISSDDYDGVEDSDASRSASPSEQASRSGHVIREVVPAGPSHTALESDDDDDAEMTTDNDESFDTYSEVAPTEQTYSELEEDDDYEQHSVNDRGQISAFGSSASEMSPPLPPPRKSKRDTGKSVRGIAKSMSGMSIAATEADEDDDPLNILPAKKTRGAHLDLTTPKRTIKSKH